MTHDQLPSEDVDPSKIFDVFGPTSHPLAKYLSRFGIEPPYEGGPTVLRWIHQYLVKPGEHSWQREVLSPSWPEMDDRDLQDFVQTCDSFFAECDLEGYREPAREPGARRRFSSIKGNQVAAFLDQSATTQIPPQLWIAIKILFIRRLVVDRIERSSAALDADALRKICDSSADRSFIQTSDGPKRAAGFFVAELLRLSPSSIDQQLAGRSPESANDRSAALMSAFKQNLNELDTRLAEDEIELPDAIVRTRDVLISLASHVHETPQQQESTLSDSRDSKPQGEEAQNDRKRSKTPSSPRRAVQAHPTGSVPVERTDVSSDPESPFEPVTHVRRVLSREVSEGADQSNQKLQRYWLHRLEQTNPASHNALLPAARQWLRQLFSDGDQGLDSTGRAARILLRSEVLFGVEVDLDSPTSFQAAFGVLSAQEVTRELSLADPIWTPQEVEKPRFLPMLSEVVLWSEWKNDAPFDVSSLNSDEVARSYKTMRSELNSINGAKISDGRLRNLLAEEALLRERNSLVSASLDTASDLAMPAMAWYMGLQEPRIVASYHRACEELLGLKSTDQRQGIPNDASTVWELREPELMGGFARAKSAAKSALENDAGDIIDLHREFTHYTLFVLEFSLGFRPVNDPLGVLDQIDTDVGYCLLCDKVTVPTLAYRLLALPKIAADQLREYRKYLKWLEVELASSPGGLEASLAVESLVSSNANQSIPQFFSLNRVENDTGSAAEITVEHLTTSQQAAWIEQHLPIAPNEGRRWIATHLDRSGINYQWLVAVLGHHEQSAHQFGRLSLYSPAEALKTVAATLDALLRDLGLGVLRFTKRVSKLAKQRADAQLRLYPASIAQEVDAAHFIRMKERLRVFGKQRALVKEVLSEHSDLSKQSEVSRSEVARLFQSLIDKTVDQQMSVHRSVQLLELELAKWRKGGVNVAPSNYCLAEPEPSPFHDRSLLKYRYSLEVRDRFTSEFQRLAKSTHEVSPDKSLALGIISLAVHAGVASVSLLEALASASFEVFWVDGDLCLLVEESLAIGGRDGQMERATIERIVAPDSLSAACFLRVHSRRAQVRGTRVDEALRSLARDVGLSGGDLSETLSSLVDVAKSLGQFEAPGLLLSMKSQKIQHRSLSKAGVARLLTRKAFIDPASTEVVPGGGVQTRFSKSRFDSSSGAGKALKELASWLNAACRKIDGSIDEPISMEGYSESGGTPASDSRDRLAKLIETVLRAEEIERFEFPLTETNFVFLGYVLAACQRKNKRHAWSTIREYYQIVARGLVAHLNGEILDLEESEIEELYFLILDSAPPKTRGKDSNVLAQFHRFLVQRFDLPEADWASIFALGGWTLPDRVAVIDANYVFLEEYERSIDYLQSLDCLQVTKDQLSILLFLGYRFGLRWSEALKLRIKDLLNPHSDRGLAVSVKEYPGRTLKTHNARRRIPIVGILSEREAQCLRRVYERRVAMTRAAGAVDEPLFDQLTGDQALYSSSFVSHLINSSLRQASGDPAVRFHHLRHSYCSALLMIATRDRVKTESAYFGRLRERLLEGLGLEEPSWLPIWGSEPAGHHSLQAVADLMGHGSSAVGVSAYAHFWDAVVPAMVVSPNDFDDRLMAFALGMPYSNYHKQKMRLERSEQPLTLSALRGRGLKDCNGVSFSDFTADPKAEFEIARPTAGQITLSELDTAIGWIARSRRDQQSLEEACLLFGLERNPFIDSVIAAERETGFDRYALRWLGDPLHHAELVPPNLPSMAEDRATQLAAHSLNPVISCLSADIREACLLGLRALAVGNPDRDKYFVMVEKHDAETTEKTLSVLGWSEAFLTDSITNLEAQPSSGAKSASEIARSYRKGATWIAKEWPFELKTNGGFRRLLFLLSAFFHYQNNLAAAGSSKAQ